MDPRDNGDVFTETLEWVQFWQIRIEVFPRAGRLVGVPGVDRRGGEP
ncbi:hypothetical protein [Mycobacterium sp. IS-1496]|nr:hypothetical protein [Mycobacterium sp. IS-1496]